MSFGWCRGLCFGLVQLLVEPIFLSNIWSVLDILDCGISVVVSLEVSFPSLDFCAEGKDVHGRRG